MKIYKISQDVNNDYDTYDSAVVYAESEEDAKSIHPNGKDIIIYAEYVGCLAISLLDKNKGVDFYTDDDLYDWAQLKDIKVEYIGEAPHITEKCVILASFNAG